MSNQQEPEQFRKLFIGGLSYETTEDSLKSYFGKWGDICDCVVMRDPNTKRSRGFGFITYERADSLDEAQANRPHTLDKKEVETKRATPREESGKPEAHMTIKKVFVGGVKDDTEDEHLRDYFSKYGNVLKVDIITDKETKKKRGFAFVEFDDYDPVDKVVLEKNHYIAGKRCDVKKAVDKKDLANMPQRGGMNGGRGGGRGGRGGGGGRWMGNDRNSNFGGGNQSYGNNSGNYGGGNYGGGNYGGGNFNGGGDNWNNNQGGGNWGNNQGGGNGWNNQGGGNWGNNQGGGSYNDGNYGGGNQWGNNSGGNYGSGPNNQQQSYGGGYNNQGGGGGGGGSGGPMKGGNYTNRGSGPYGGGYGNQGGGGYGGGGNQQSSGGGGGGGGNYGGGYNRR